MAPVEQFLAAGVPLTYAILPGEQFTPQIAEKLAHQELLLHIPLEPIGFPEVNPGGYALLTSMTDAEIADAARKLLASVPGIRGVNNHMGSAFTEDERCMKVLLQAVQETGLYFLDSRTSIHSKARESADTMGFPIFASNLFLDSLPGEDHIRAQLEVCKRIALKKGVCIAIGHVHSKELPRILREIYQSFLDEGISFVTVSELGEYSGVNTNYDTTRN